MFELVRGEALLQAGGSPIWLAVDGDALVCLRHGRAHALVVSTAEEGSDGAHSWLRLDSGAEAEVYFPEAESRHPVTFRGPQRLILRPAGAEVASDPGAAQNPFRQLDIFGGPLISYEDRSLAVPGVHWRVREGSAQRAAVPSSLGSGRFRLGTAAPALLAWQPTRKSAEATRIALALRAPIGTEVSFAGALQGEPVLRLERDTRADEPGLAGVTLDLPEGWLTRLAGDELVLRIRVPEGDADAAWFDGVRLEYRSPTGPTEGGTR